MTYTSATCTAESDGFHEHVYRSGITRVTEHLHTWMDEHLERWPGSSRVYLGDQAYAGTVEQAWAEVTSQPLPEVACELADVTVVQP